MENSTTTGQRQHERPVVNGEATVRTASIQATGSLVDVSEGGLQVLCRVPVSVGESVEVCFTPEGYPNEIRAQGKVSRVGPDRVGIDLTQTASWPATWQELKKFYAPSKRLHERYPAEGEARIYAGSNEAKCVVENVSRDGLQIRTDIPVSISSRVEVRFTPPGYSEQITAAGRVASIRGDYIGIDFTQVSSWRANWRKLVAFRTVSQKKQDGPLTPEMLISQIAAIQKEAAASPEVSVKTAALWKMESLGVTFGRIAQTGETLNDPNLPVEACPIVHVGMGGAAVEVANFDPAEITGMIVSLAHPKYRLFGYEQIGAMLGVYEKTIPRLMLGLKRLNRPDPAQFIPLFPPEVQRLIAHGYGRLLYFNSKDIHAALRNIKKREFLDPRAAVQGMAFGYTMVNHVELEVVLETGDSLLDPALVKAFKAGLIYALEFWEWMSPGFLGTLQFSSPRASELISIARDEIAAARHRGAIRAFAVG
ncbi:MAG: PilZ domain-containing protein [Acidobacteria bacterium]|nr:PilZ domain-containing protein [Acidobacteriota bacterium]